MKVGFFDKQRLVEHEVNSISEFRRFIAHMKNEYPDMDKQGLDDFFEQTLKSHLGEDYSCKKCLPEDHESVFCRCEDRNIKVARLNREMLKDNRAEE